VLFSGPMAFASRLSSLALASVLTVAQTSGEIAAGQDSDPLRLEGKTLRVTATVDGPSGGYRASWIGHDLRAVPTGPGFTIIPNRTELSVGGGVEFEARSWTGGDAYTDTFFTTTGRHRRTFTLSEAQIAAAATGRSLPTLPLQVIVFGHSYIIPAVTPDTFAGTRVGRTEVFRRNEEDPSAWSGPEVRVIDQDHPIEFGASVTIGDRAGRFAGNQSAAPAPRSRVQPVSLGESNANGFTLFDPETRTITSDDPLTLVLDDSFTLPVAEGFRPYVPISMNPSAGDQGGVRSYTATVAWSLNTRVDLTTMLDQPDRDWRPRYRVDASTGALDTVDVTARLMTPGVEGRWRFTLSDVTAVPGVAMNLGTGVGFDLRFDRTRGGWGPERATPDGFEIETTTASTEATVRVRSLDHGAWGRLSAEVNVAGEWYRVDTADGTGHVTIPLDDNEDRVADVWADMYRVDGLGADWDGDDEPAGGADAGDGLTVYEEYRGFATGGIVLSTDPRRRTLFIHAPNGLASYVTAPIARGLQVLFIDETEFVDTSTRVVNFNHDGYANRGDQHGLWLLDADIGGRLFWGLAEGTDADPQAPRPVGSPGTCSRVLVDRAQIEWDLGARRRFSGIFRSTGAYAELTDAFIAETVDHELGHCLGMRHHEPERALPACVMRASYADMESARLSADMVGTAYCDMNWAELDVSDPH
jgi:hypothetical protein